MTGARSRGLKPSGQKLSAAQVVAGVVTLERVALVCWFTEGRRPTASQPGRSGTTLMTGRAACGRLNNSSEWRSCWMRGKPPLLRRAHLPREHRRRGWKWPGSWNDARLFFSRSRGICGDNWRLWKRTVVAVPNRRERNQPRGNPAAHRGPSIARR